MPQISGSLRTITTAPSSVREVLVRAPEVRPSGTGVVLTEPVRVPVSTEGSFTVTLAVGAAVLVVVDDHLVRESIPLLVTESTTTVAQAMQQAEDFSPEVHDRLAELAGSALGSVALVQGAAAKVAADRSAVETASSQAVSANRDAQAAKTSAVEAWQGLRTRLDSWAENIELLTRWQPQYEWLRSNAASSFGVVQERITQAASEVVSQVRGLADQARRASDSAGTHETRARGYADRAASAATSAVTAEINKLKGSAPAAFDTLAEIADRIKAGGSLESELLRKIAEKASNSEFQALVSRVSGLSVSSISGLSAALAGKASSSHRHVSADITDATDASSPGKLIKRDGFGRAKVKDPSSGEDIANKQYVDGLLGGLRFARGRGSDPNTVYFEV